MVDLSIVKPQSLDSTGFAALGEAYFSHVAPTPLPQPRLIHVNMALAAQLGLDPDDPDFLPAMAGNAPLLAQSPLATVYAGHQFGVFVPQLGDGRAHLIATLASPQGPQELQLKGGGPTPYSRHADGRAVLRSSIREYLCSEAMHALGIPTTRALALVGSPHPVRRETIETAAVVCRVAPSFVRFGHFEFFYYRNQHDKLAPLAEHVIDSHFPEFAGQPDRYRLWLTEVVERTARLMAQWLTVGFCHGVMNTDNFSVLGLTLDYGPFGFQDGFAAGQVCNHSDDGGRYAWDRQPGIGHWNCSRLLQATLPLLHEDGEQAVVIANEILDRYPSVYAQAVRRRWADKLGLRELREDDAPLINRFLALLDSTHADFTRSFRALSRIRVDGHDDGGPRDEIADPLSFDTWAADYRARLASEQSDDIERSTRMDAANPLYVLRNHLAQQAIERAEGGDFSEFERLQQVLQRPFETQPERETYAAEPPPGLGHLVVSCSS